MTEAPTRIVVRATAMNFYGGVRVRAGQTFTLTDPTHFNPKTMTYADPATPDDIASAREASPKQIGDRGGVESKPRLKARSGVRVQPATSFEPDPGI